MEEKNKDNYKVRRENLSQWILKFEDHCLKVADIGDDVKEYIKYSMKVSEKPSRKYFHDNYLFNLDENLNVMSSKENYDYHDFYRKIDPYAPLPKDLFKNSNENKFE